VVQGWWCGEIVQLKNGFEVVQNIRTARPCSWTDQKYRNSLMPLQRPIARNKRYLTRSEFARRVGLTPEAIYKAVKCGRIKTCTRDGETRIDWYTQGAAFVASSPTAVIQLNGNGNGNGNGNETTQHMSISQSREKQERFKALKLELEYMERMGRLVDTEAMNMNWVAIGTMIRKAVSRIPDRIAPSVAPETDEHTVYQIIDNECHTILEDLASEIDRRKIELPGGQSGVSDTATGAVDDNGMG
jgi:phage terminase Nu1 subunit (DNA packaging protein)